MGLLQILLKKLDSDRERGRRETRLGGVFFVHLRHRRKKVSCFFFFFLIGDVKHDLSRFPSSFFLALISQLILSPEKKKTKKVGIIYIQKLFFPFIFILIKRSMSLMTRGDFVYNVPLRVYKLLNGH